MNITKQQSAAIKKATRAANRRIERAAVKSPGQARYLESVVKKMTGGSTKFSAATKGLTYEQAAKKIEMLNKFMAREATKRSGWEKLRLKAIQEANKKLSGYDLTDQELADIMIQTDSSKDIEFYRAINLVTAKKAELGDEWSGDYEQISAAIGQKISYQQSLQMALQARPGINPPMVNK